MLLRSSLLALVCLRLSCGVEGVRPGPDSSAGVPPARTARGAIASQGSRGGRCDKLQHARLCHRRIRGLVFFPLRRAGRGGRTWPGAQALSVRDVLARAAKELVAYLCTRVPCTRSLRSSAFHVPLPYRVVLAPLACCLRAADVPLTWRSRTARATLGRDSRSALERHKSGI